MCSGWVGISFVRQLWCKDKVVVFLLCFSMVLSSRCMGTWWPFFCLCRNLLCYLETTFVYADKNLYNCRILMAYYNESNHHIHLLFLLYVFVICMLVCDSIPVKTNSLYACYFVILFQSKSNMYSLLYVCFLMIPFQSKIFLSDSIPVKVTSFHSLWFHSNQS